MRNTRSTRTVASAGLSGDVTVALPAVTLVESPGMSNRRSLPVAWALLRPVLMSAVVVSNAAVPGRVVAATGTASFVNCQMSPATPPIDTAEEALAWPGTPGWSANASVTLAQEPQIGSASCV